jgi:hypothetical protein
MYETKFLHALAFTVISETALLFVLISCFFKEIEPQKNFWRIVVTGIVCSGFTLPYIWFILPKFICGKPLFAVIAETWAVVAEAVIIMWALRIKTLQSFLVSFICNAVSFILGKIAFSSGLL